MTQSSNDDSPGSNLSKCDLSRAINASWPVESRFRADMCDILGVTKIDILAIFREISVVTRTTRS